MNPAYRLSSGLLAVLLVLAPLSCGDDEGGDSLGVNNVSPKGSVGGLVVDAATMAPMQGVKVSVVAGGALYPSGESTAVTDANGYFSVADLPAGELIVQLTPSDPKAYRAVNIAATLQNAAGEFPLANATLSLGPIGLVPLASKTGVLTVQLVTTDGAPAVAGIKAYLRASLEWIDFHGGGVAQQGLIVVEGTSTNSGMVSFVGMPDFFKLAGLVGSGGISDVVRIQIPPFDSNKDGVMDFLGREDAFNVTKLKGAIPTIVLNSAAKPNKLIIEAASIAALAGKSGNRVMTSTSGPIYITFNLPVRQDMTEVFLFDELGQAVVSPPTKAVSGNVLTINFTSLKAAAEYNLNVRTFADVEGDLLEGYFGAPAFTPAQAGSTVKATLTRDAGDPTKLIVSFNEPVGSGVPNQSLSGANCVLYFDYDLNGTGIKGDAPSERNADSSVTPMYIVELDPPGPAGKSGLSSYWTFTLPNDAMGNPIPAGTAFDIVFSGANFALQRASGALVPDIKNLTVPF